MPTPTLSPEAAAYLASFDPRLLSTAAGRRILTRTEPRLFALLYLRHHLHGVETGSVISFSEAHLDWYQQMTEWAVTPLTHRGWRRAYVAPRASAKSTTWFTIAPMWAGAHGYLEFVAAFADSAGQAETHLSTFKHELETNALLRADFPEFTTPMRRERGTTTFDSRSMIQMQSGFVFAAKGIDAASLGLKVGEKRPDLILFDDVEPSESNYSPYLAEKRLSTITNAVLPLNEFARAVIVGTVTMDGSLVHQLVKSTTSTEAPAAWITDERFVTTYHPALITNDDASERSLWPEKWPLGFLKSISHQRSFALNYQNQPVPLDGSYWSAEDILVEEQEAYLQTVITVDPAVTSQKTSDFTGIAVCSYDPTTKKMTVRDAWQVKLKPSDLRGFMITKLGLYPEVKAVIVEKNNGGEYLEEVLGGLGPKFVYNWSSGTKESRAHQLAYGYQKGEVVHAEHFKDLVSQMLAYPNVRNDDLIDAVGTGYAFFFDNKKGSTLKSSVESYL